jgi:hypothetical protein
MGRHGVDEVEWQRGFRPFFPAGTCDLGRLRADFVRFFTMSVSSREIHRSVGFLTRPQ